MHHKKAVKVIKAVLYIISILSAVIETLNEILIKIIKCLFRTIIENPITIPFIVVAIIRVVFTIKQYGVLIALRTIALSTIVGFTVFIGVCTLGTILCDLANKNHK